MTKTRTVWQIATKYRIRLRGAYRQNGRHELRERGNRVDARRQYAGYRAVDRNAGHPLLEQSQNDKGQRHDSRMERRVWPAPQKMLEGQSVRCINDAVPD